MVRNKNFSCKPAFSMIELIFAIVIISVSVISLPMMTQATSKAIEENLVQEAVFAASTELNQIVSYYWDENSTQSGDSLSKVINTGDCDDTTRLRAGHINQPLHRRCLDSNTTTPSATLGLEASESVPDDIDDVTGTSSVFQSFIASAEGYKKAYNKTVIVEYADFDATTAVSKNIKKITVTIKDTDGNDITKLSTFSANIGEIDYYKRSY